MKSIKQYAWVRYLDMPVHPIVERVWYVVYWVAGGYKDA